MRRNGEFTSKLRLFRQGLSPMGVMVSLYLVSVFFDFITLIPGISPSRLVAILLVVYFLFNAGRMRIRLDAVTGLLFFLILFATTSFFFLANPAAGFNNWISLVLNLVIVMASRFFLYTDCDVRLFSYTLAAGGAAMVLLLFVTPGDVGGGWSERVVVEIAGSQQDANEFNGYLIFLAAFAAYLSLSRGRYLTLMLLVPVLYASMLTGSRGGLLAICSALFMAVVFGLARSRYRVVTACVVFVALAVLLMNVDAILSALPSGVADRFAGLSVSSGTAQYRARAWGNILDAFLQSPLLQQLFGHGFSSTTTVTWNGLVAHNAYLEILYSCGLAGFFCYVGLFACALSRAVRARSFAQAAAMVGGYVLLFTLSAIALKTVWAIVLVGLVSSDPERLSVADLGSNGRARGSAGARNLGVMR